MNKQRRNEVLIKGITDRLREVRKSKGLTPQNVSSDTGLNIKLIETGQHSITLTKLGDLCDYYGITLSEFFRGMKTK